LQDDCYSPDLDNGMAVAADVRGGNQQNALANAQNASNANLRRGYHTTAANTPIPCVLTAPSTKTPTPSIPTPPTKPRHSTAANRRNKRSTTETDRRNQARPSPFPLSSLQATDYTTPASASFWLFTESSGN
jgi:hypothetical protein